MIGRSDPQLAFALSEIWPPPTSEIVHGTPAPRASTVPLNSRDVLGSECSL